MPECHVGHRGDLQSVPLEPRPRSSLVQLVCGRPLTFPRTASRLALQSVQTFGRKKSAVAVSFCKKGRGLIKINGCPIELVEPELLRYKVFEPILLLGRERFAIMDLRIRVKGGGYTSQIYGAHSRALRAAACTTRGCQRDVLPAGRRPPLRRTARSKDGRAPPC